MSLSRPITYTTTNPHVRELFRIVNTTEIKMEGLAELIGVSPTTIRDWAIGESRPRIHNLEAAFNVLGYTLTVQPMEAKDGKQE